MSLLDVRDLSVSFGVTRAVNGLSFSLEAGEAVGLVGESGCGKSATALAIMGLLPATAKVAGSVRLQGEALLGQPQRRLDPYRATRISMVFQDPLDALNPYLKVGRQLGRILRAHRIASGKQAERRVLDMLDRVGLPDPERQARAYPHQLSGGMRQRAMLAAALIAEPDLLLADEPTTALDVTVQAQILDLLDEIRRETALLLITHDLGIVAGHCRRLLVLDSGRLVESGDTANVFAAPDSPTMAALLAATPRLDRGTPPAALQSAVMLRAEALSVAYVDPGLGELHAVKQADIDLKSGETVSIVGESGSGKSSLVRALLGLVPADSGTVVFAGSPLPADLDDRHGAVRRDLQLVFQEPVGSLNPQMTVAAIIAEPLRVHRPRATDTARNALVLAMLGRVGLGDEFAGRYPHQLSGGQAQRVAIARALVLEPRVLVCDEAVAALDGTVRKKVLELLVSIQQSTGLSILFITHDLAVAHSISHRVAVMYAGRIVEFGDSRRLFERPSHPYTRALLEAVPVPDPAVVRASHTPGGEVPSLEDPPPGCAFHPRCRYRQARCSEVVPVRREVDGTSVACLRAGEADLATASAAVRVPAPR